MHKFLSLVVSVSLLLSSMAPAYAAGSSSSKSSEEFSFPIDKAPRKCSTCNIKAMEAPAKKIKRNGQKYVGFDEGWYCGNCIRKFAEANASKKGTFKKQEKENLIAKLGSIYIGYIRSNMKYWTDKQVKEANDAAIFFTRTLGLPRYVAHVNRQGEEVATSPTKDPKKKDKKPSTSRGGSPSAEYLAEGVAGAASRGGIGIGDGSGDEGGLAATYENLIRHAAFLLSNTSPYFGVSDKTIELLSEAEEKKDPELEICINARISTTSREEKRVCYPAIIWAYGAGYEAYDSLYYQGKIIPQSIPAYVHLIGAWGLFSSQDFRFAESVFYSVLEDNTCGKNKDEKTDTCYDEMMALIGLPMVAADKEKARKTIEKILNKYWDSPSGSVIIPLAISSLMSFETKEAWDAIDKFLTSTILQGSLLDVFDTLSVNFWIENGFKVWYENGGRAFKYYKNEAQFNRKEYGTKFGYNVVNEDQQPPYSNTIEDVGGMLSQMKDNEYAQQIVNKIIGAAIKYAKNPYEVETSLPVLDPLAPVAKVITSFKVFNKGSWPVVIGILEEGADNPKAVAFSDREGMQTLLKFLSGKNEFWDVTAGTQLHIWDVAGKFSNKYLGTPYETPTRKDERFQGKFERYEALENGKFVGEVADTALFVFGIGSVIRALPALVRKAPAIVRFITGARVKSGEGAMRILSKLKGVRKAVSSGGKGISATGSVTGEAAGEASGLEAVSNAATKTTISEAKTPTSGSAARPGAKSQSTTPGHPAADAPVGNLQQEPRSWWQRGKDAIKERVDDARGAMGDWWGEKVRESQKLGIVQEPANPNPFNGLGDAYKARRAARAGEQAVLGETAGGASSEIMGNLGSQVEVAKARNSFNTIETLARKGWRLEGGEERWGKWLKSVEDAMESGKWTATDTKNLDDFLKELRSAEAETTGYGRLEILDETFVLGQKINFNRVKEIRFFFPDELKAAYENAGVEYEITTFESDGKLVTKPIVKVKNSDDYARFTKVVEEKLPNGKWRVSDHETGTLRAGERAQGPRNALVRDANERISFHVHRRVEDTTYTFYVDLTELELVELNEQGQLVELHKTLGKVLDPNYIGTTIRKVKGAANPNAKPIPPQSAQKILDSAVQLRRELMAARTTLSKMFTRGGVDGKISGLWQIEGLGETSGIKGIDGISEELLNAIKGLSVKLGYSEYHFLGHPAPVP